MSKAKSYFLKQKVRCISDGCTSITGDLRFAENRTEIVHVYKSGTWKITNPTNGQWYDIVFTATLSDSNVGFSSGLIVFFQPIFVDATAGRTVEIQKVDGLRYY